jgi:hypothetical protein
MPEVAAAGVEQARSIRPDGFTVESNQLQEWRVRSARVWVVAHRRHRLVVAVKQATGEAKYFLSNATGEPLARVP